MKIVQKRRRRENKTDYSLRLRILKQGTGRVVFRKTNRKIIGQYVESNDSKDHVIAGFNSQKLLKLGWPKEKSGSLKSLSAAYLSGLALGKMMIKKSKKSAIFDLGLQRNTAKSRAYAFLKGVIDAGVSIPADKSVFPEEIKIKGEKLGLKDVFAKTMENISNGR